MNRQKFPDSNRIATISFDYLIAELIAFPLTSVSAFKHPIISMDPHLKEKATRKLWRDAEHQIIRSIPDLSIDQAVAIRDRLWFDRSFSGSPVCLHDFLARIANDYLEPNGPVAIPRSAPPSDTGESAEDMTNTYRHNPSLRWLSFSLPPDMLLGALGKSHRIPAEIRHLSPQLSTRLSDKGFAEVHLHIWASLEFPILWVATLHALASIDQKNHEKAFESPGADFDEGRHLGKWLLRAAIARYLLALFLYELSISSQQNISFFKYFSRILLPTIGEYQGAVARELVRTAIKELLGGAFLPWSPPYANLRTVYRELAETIRNPFPEQPDKIFFSDPIAHLLQYKSPNEPSPEIRFVQQGISYLRQSSQKPDLFFQTLFWQVIRLRGIFYRHIVQRPMTPGLQWFIRTYDRIKPGRRTVKPEFVIGAAAETCGIKKGLRALEVRTSPEASSSEIMNIIRDFLNGLKKYVKNDDDFKTPLSSFRQSETDLLKKYVKNDDFEFGIVFHFSKLRGGKAYKGLPAARWMDTHANPRIEQDGKIHEVRSRYSRYYRDRKNEALALARLIFNFPKVLKVIRGIDICTDEVGVPTWVLIPHLRYLRDAGKAASQHLGYIHNEDVPELRVTVHTGEDFIHLLSGMRRIEEAIRYFDLHSGDRLGHAIALGIDPAAWAERAGQVAISREERLFDLVWEKMHYSRDRIAWTGGRLAFIEREIVRLAKLIFGNHNEINPYDMETFVHQLHDETMLARVGYPDCSISDVEPIRNHSTERRSEQDHVDDSKSASHTNRNSFTERRFQKNYLLRYLTDSGVFERGQIIEWVDTIPEIESMKSLQNYLRQSIADMGLVVEINPSSNLLIGNLTDLKSHPLWRLNPPDKGDDTIPVSVCIGSDDPITFATSLPQEYALLYESLIAGGLSASEAYAWLEEARDTGMSSRFTRFKLREIEDNLFSHHAFGLDEHVRMMP